MDATRAVLRAAVVGGGSVLLFAVVYLLAVRTVPGQRFEDAVLTAAEARAGTVSQERATRVLSIVTASTVAVVAAGVVAIGFLRRAPRLGLLAAAVILATVAATEVLQFWLPRPVLLHSGYRRDDQSFPSGHTATAMAMMCALVLVVPYRLRWAALAASSLFAGGIAVATVVASWHRPSDTIGGDLIALAVCCAAVAWLAGRGGLRPVPRPVPKPLWALGGLYTLVTLAATAVVLAVGPLDARAGADATRGSALLTGRAIALAGAGATALMLLLVLGRAETTGTGQGSPTGPGTGRGRPSRARIAARNGPQLRYR
ncbi:phosphatase PAP2 family protein [Dactylosporangium sp. NPDC048998]|uniref:phosphatase PAP2 family protein n=1 Tax=Dactylosporangium sp. NPDC048998 TaxID=3363976 RepID=UPI00371C3D24